MYDRSRNRISLVLVLTLCSLLLAGCKDDNRDRPDEPRTWKDRPGEYRDETGFGVVPPEGWSKSDPPGEMVRVAFRDPNSPHGTNFNVVAEDVPPSARMEPLIKANLDNMERTIGGFELLDRSELQIDGLPAVRLDYKMREMGMELRGVVYILLGTDYAYYLVGTTMPQGFDKAGPVFERAAKSLKVR